MKTQFPTSLPSALIHNKRTRMQDPSPPRRNATIPGCDQLVMKAHKIMYGEILEQASIFKTMPGGGGKRARRIKFASQTEPAGRPEVHSLLVEIRKAIRGFDLRSLQKNFHQLAISAPEHAYMIFVGSRCATHYRNEPAANAREWKEVGRILEAHVN